MVDHKGLGIIGCILGVVTASVMLIAFVVVLDDIDGSLAHDATAVPVATLR